MCGSDFPDRDTLEAVLPLLRVVLRVLTVQKRRERFFECVGITRGSQQCLEPLDLAHRADLPRLFRPDLLEFELQEIENRVLEPFRQTFLTAFVEPSWRPSWRPS